MTAADDDESSSRSWPSNSRSLTLTEPNTPTDEVTIVRLGPGHAKLLIDVAEDVFDAPVDPVRAAAFLADPAHILVVASHRGSVIGQCAAVVHRHPDKPTELYIDEIGVTPEFQRRGIGRRMLEAAFEAGRAAGCEEAWLGTEHENAAALALYESAGGAREPFLAYSYDLTGIEHRLPKSSAGVARAQQERGE